MLRTSITHPLPIAEIPCGNGLLGLTYCPGKKGESVHGAAWDRNLIIDLDRIAEWGPRAVLTLMEAHELDLLNVPDLGLQIERRGMEWLHMPIVDVSIPDTAFERRWADIGHFLRSHLRAGDRVVVHCRGGLGRTGLVAARLLIEFGDAPDLAISKVRFARPGAIETPEQEFYVRRLKPIRHERGVEDRILLPTRRGDATIRQSDPSVSGAGT